MEIWIYNYEFMFFTKRRFFSGRKPFASTTIINTSVMNRFCHCSFSSFLSHIILVKCPQHRTFLGLDGYLVLHKAQNQYGVQGYGLTVIFFAK